MRRCRPNRPGSPHPAASQPRARLTRAPRPPPTPCAPAPRRAREALRQCLPDSLRDATFSTALKDDVSTKRWLSQLLFNITTDAQPSG